MEIRSDDQNQVIILGRYHCFNKSANEPLESFTLDNIRPNFTNSIHNADVVLLMDGKEFSVLKHRHLQNLSAKYHRSSLTNIMFAR